MSTRPDRTATAPLCPVGGTDHAEPVAAVRVGVADYADVYPHLSMKRGTATGIADVAWRCPTCGHEWGYEVLTDDYLAEVERLTGGRTREHQERAVGIIARGWGVNAPTDPGSR